ncbi:Protein TAPT1-like [Porphyridium purpureum]|uniref:Protein TAPT1-like n=1 Tax=Porphyridium purpureum TaxID=35688 RepID=A0A5J4YLS1_PORPP|nr:Protein TAPT1-like [Porphyridium purpureum]|eukprot:POR3586..scf295_9
MAKRSSGVLLGFEASEKRRSPAFDMQRAVSSVDIGGSRHSYQLELKPADPLEETAHSDCEDAVRMRSRSAVFDSRTRLTMSATVAPSVWPDERDANSHPVFDFAHCQHEDNIRLIDSSHDDGAVSTEKLDARQSKTGGGGVRFHVAVNAVSSVANCGTGKEYDRDENDHGVVSPMGSRYTLGPARHASPSISMSEVSNLPEGANHHNGYGRGNGHMRTDSSEEIAVTSALHQHTPSHHVELCGSVLRYVVALDHERLVAKDVIGESLMSDHKSALVLNFVRVPLRLERFLMLGFLLCMDEFLNVLTFLPIRLLLTTFLRLFTPENWRARITASRAYRASSSPDVPPHAGFTRAGGTSRPLKNTERSGCGLSGSGHGSGLLSVTELVDTIHVLLVVAGFAWLALFDISRVFHFIRAQHLLKLYVIFNVLEILEKLCSSFGIDILDSLGFSSAEVVRVFRAKSSAGSARAKVIYIGRLASECIIALIYVLIHATCLLGLTVTLNVAVNSKNNSLITLLISNNFVELKGTVLKSFRIANVFQFSCADAVERFQLVLFLSLMWVHTSADYYYLQVWMIVLLCEVVLDWTKHAFMAKFNRLSYKEYSRFYLILCDDIMQAKKHAAVRSIGGSGVSKRMGLVPLPLVALALRLLRTQIASAPWTVLACIWLFALVVKCMLSVALLGHASKTVHTHLEQRGTHELQDEQELHVLRVLSQVDRYNLTKKD